MKIKNYKKCESDQKGLEEFFKTFLIASVFFIDKGKRNLKKLWIFPA